MILFFELELETILKLLYKNSNIPNVSIFIYFLSIDKIYFIFINKKTHYEATITYARFMKWGEFWRALNIIGPNLYEVN